MIPLPSHLFFLFIFPSPPPLQYNGAKIQLLDLPGIIEGAAQGRVPVYMIFY